MTLNIIPVLREEVAALIRYLSPQAFEKSLDAPDVSGWKTDVLDMICDALYQLGRLTQAKLQRLEAVGPSAELEEDLINLLQPLAMSFSRTCHYHLKHAKDIRAPAGVPAPANTWAVQTTEVTENLQARRASSEEQVMP